MYSMPTELQADWWNAQFDRNLQAIGLKDGFRPRIAINRQFGHYQIKIADNLDELCEAFRLRHEVFFGSSSEVKSNTAMDMDEFDLVADHLILRDLEHNKIVGTYRLLSSDRTQSFYSQSEFAMGSILKLEGRLLELDRACIHPDYRSGTCIALVWQGLGEYMKSLGATWAFGCSSVSVGQSENEIQSVRAIGTKLLRDHLSPVHMRTEPLNMHPDDRLRFAKEMSGDFSEDDQAGVVRMPPLLKGYLKLGAYIAGAPSWDPEFKTLDFFTLLPVEKMNPQFLTRFGVR